MAPTNKAANILGGVTAHKALGINDQFKMNAKLFVKLKFKYIIVDEISMIDVRMWTVLSYIKAENPEMKMILCGDHRQLPPVETLAKDYFSSTMLKRLCDHNRVLLTVNKRSDSEMFRISEHLHKTGELDVEPFGARECRKSLCYRNVTRKTINDIWMKREWTNTSLIIKRDPEDPEYAQDMILNKGTPLISKVNDGKRNIRNNEYHVVYGYNSRFVMIKGNPHQWTYSDFMECFVVGYCSTIHTSQGETFEEDYTIYDWEHIMKTSIGKPLLYVAITRTTDKQKINFGSCKTSSKFTVIYKDKYLQHKIQGYKHQDKRKRATNNLTLKNVKRLVEEQCNQCHHCGKLLNEECFTLDRQNDEGPHNVSNCVLSCFECNVRKSKSAF